MMDVSCPHCPMVKGGCHVCNGTRRISLFLAERIIGWAWSTAGCGCDACLFVGPIRG
jgi:hypothetical protein